MRLNKYTASLLRRILNYDCLWKLSLFSLESHTDHIYTLLTPYVTHIYILLK
jgi:hypothetical protein